MSKGGEIAEKIEGDGEKRGEWRIGNVTERVRMWRRDGGETTQKAKRSGTGEGRGRRERLKVKGKKLQG